MKRANIGWCLLLVIGCKSSSDASVSPEPMGSSSNAPTDVAVSDDAGSTERPSSGLATIDDGSDGSDAGSGDRDDPVPHVRLGPAEVEGPLDGDIIRRITNAHINEIRYCYGVGLKADSSLAGTVTIDFAIDSRGQVSASTLASSDLSDEEVGRCAAEAVKRWKYPKPSGGETAKVRYPFILSPR